LTWVNPAYNSVFFIDAGNRTAVNGLLNQVLRPVIRHDDLCLFNIGIKFEHFGTDLFTGAAPDTLILVNTYINKPPNKIIYA